MCRALRAAMATFTVDWISLRTPYWEKVLSSIAGLPEIRGLEIGVYEGRATLWFLENVLTHQTSSMVCIDPCCQRSFFENIGRFSGRVRLIQGLSQEVLRTAEFTPGSFDFVYVDGDHHAIRVLEDAVLSFPLLKIGGVLIFDDYEWKSPIDSDPRASPKLAIDSFLNVYQGSYELLHRGWQVIVRKTR